VLTIRGTHIRPAQPTEHAALVMLWERSVRATHAFLTEADILFYRPLVAEFFRAPRSTCGCSPTRRATYRKMVQNLLWATGYNVVALPLAAGALYAWGVLLTPALGAVFMSASTVIVAINARLLRLKK